MCSFSYHNRPGPTLPVIIFVDLSSLNKIEDLCNIWSHIGRISESEVKCGPLSWLKCRFQFYAYSVSGKYKIYEWKWGTNASAHSSRVYKCTSSALHHCTLWMAEALDQKTQQTEIKNEENFSTTVQLFIMFIKTWKVIWNKLLIPWNSFSANVRTCETEG